MENIRQAEKKDISRIAEILVFSKRMNYRRIFHNDSYSFGELQVLSVAHEYLDNLDSLKKIWVYDEEFVKGLICIEGEEVKHLYTDSFFVNCGIGGKLLEFAIAQYKVRYLWALEKNVKAIAFYERHGFRHQGEWMYEEGTTEKLWKLWR